MPQTREAVDTIKGYYYQFDYFILKLLDEDNKEALICIEGIEDIDIENVDLKKSIQCKYYAKTEYQHSILKKPIRLMLEHYISNRKSNLKYYIYGYYKSGQNKLPNDIDVNFLKEKFLTYTESGKNHKVFEELKISDSELQEFLLSLSIDINAMSYEEQEKTILTKMKKIFNCDNNLANYYYSDALSIVKELSTKSNINDRKINPNQFLERIKEKKDKVFNSLFIYKKGIEQYCKFIKKEYFSPFNISPYERIFLIECDEIISDVEIKSLIYEISKKWGNISQRNDKPYCPYILLYNINENRLKKIKKTIQLEEHIFSDGYDFKDADFYIKAILKQANYKNRIEFKIINNINELSEIIKKIDKTKEIYQFYKEHLFHKNDKEQHRKIKITRTEDIMNMI